MNSNTKMASAGTKLCLLALCALSLGLRSPISANTFYLDFGTSQGTPPGNWNPITGASAPNLIDYNSGLPTSVSLALTGLSNGGGSPDTWIAGTRDWVVDAAADDFFVTDPGGTGVLTFSGLTPGTYSAEIVSAHPFNSVNGDIEVSGAFANRTFTGAIDSLGDDWDANINGTNPGNWLIWDTVTVPPSGVLNVTVTDDLLPADMAINAMRLVGVDRSQVPETLPSGLVCLALFGLIAYAQKSAKGTGN